MKTKWTFTNARSTAVFTTLDVIEEGKPIMLVTHDQDDGAWQFHTGKTDPASYDKVVSLDDNPKCAL